MALFKSGNPTLTDKIFSRSLSQSDEGTMTIKGTMSKFGLLLFLAFAGAVYTWSMYGNYQIATMQTLMWTGIIGGLISVLIISFAPKTAKYLAPVYSILEGFFLGGISVIIQNAFQKSYPNIVLQAVGLTFAVAIAMFALYNFKIIKPTEKFKSIIISATVGIGLFYLVALILQMFHVNVGFMYNASPLGIGISLFVTAIAALNLILDFDQIEQGQSMGAPKFMEWYSAFGLLVTIVWLYLEILKLLMRFAGNSKN